MAAPLSLSRRSGLALLLGSLAATAPLAAQDTTQRTVGASGLPLPRYRLARRIAGQRPYRPQHRPPDPLGLRAVGAAGADRRGVGRLAPDRGSRRRDRVGACEPAVDATHGGRTRPGRAGIASDGRHRRPRGRTAGAWGHRRRWAAATPTGAGSRSGASAAGCRVRCSGACRRRTRLTPRPAPRCGSERPRRSGRSPCRAAAPARR